MENQPALLLKKQLKIQLRINWKWSKEIEVLYNFFLMKGLIFRIFNFSTVLLAALGIWMLFSPGLMNADSIVQYQQALSGNFDDWHPPVMAILVFYILKIGGSIAVVTLIQVLSGFIGVYLLIKKLLFYSKPLDESKELYALIIFLILISPFSAFSYYMVTFIKDTWLAICFIWISYFSLSLLKGANRYFLKLTLLIISIIMAILLRHNALVLLPVFFIIIYRIGLKMPFTSRNNWINTGVRYVFAASPLLLFLLFNSLIYSKYEVKKTRPVDQVIAMESLGAVVEKVELKNELEYLSTHLVSGYEDAYIPGNVAPVMTWGPVKAVDENFNIHSENLRKEYFSLYYKAPIILMKVKLQGFLNMLFPSYRYWFHPQLDANSYGLVFNNKFKEIRNALINISHFIYSSFFSIFFGEHFFWFFLNFFCICWMIFQKKFTEAFFILLIPLFYYLSYLIASTGPQFRFMFPATLISQVIFLSWIFTYAKNIRLKLKVWNILCFGYSECNEEQESLYRKKRNRIYTSELIFENQNKDIKVVVNPNPADESVTITIEGVSDNQNFSFTLFDMQGKSTFNGSFTGSSKRFSLVNLKDGTYLYKIAQDDFALDEGKLVIQH